eukprot:425128-Pleurochrysis_carterae.AAC.6
MRFTTSQLRQQIGCASIGGKSMLHNASCTRGKRSLAVVPPRPGEGRRKMWVVAGGASLWTSKTCASMRLKIPCEEQQNGGQR